MAIPVEPWLLAHGGWEEHGAGIFPCAVTSLYRRVHQYQVRMAPVHDGRRLMTRIATDGQPVTSEDTRFCDFC